MICKYIIPQLSAIRDHYNAARARESVAEDGCLYRRGTSAHTHHPV